MASSLSSGSGRELSIGVDARGLHSTGVGRYIREVLAGLFGDARFRRITLLGHPEELASFVADHGASEKATIYPFLPSWSGRRAQLAWLALRARGHTRADAWFFPFFDVPWVGHPPRSVVTVHDLIGLKVPELSSTKYRVATRVALYAAAHLTRRIIAVSESTGRDILERNPRVAAKLEVVPQGVNPAFQPLSARDLAQCSRVAALRPFLLCVGNRFAHKNHVAAVDALAHLRSEGRDLRLVVAGGRHKSEWPGVVRHAEKLGVENALVDLDEVTDLELRCLYAHCEAFLFPSLYEGFGLPVLEAMACGAPVIASDRSSLPEVVGDAGFLIDPHDAVAVAAAVRRLQYDPALRADLIRRGIERASRFTWSDTAKRTADILYRTAAGQ